MSLTVVTVRDENGAPSTLESYAGASRYRIGDGNLEIMAPNQQILGLYGSGNWLSVYAGDTVKIVSIGTVLDFSPPADLDSCQPGATEPESGSDVEPPFVEPAAVLSSIEPAAAASSTEPDAETMPSPTPRAAVERPVSEQAVVFVTPTERPAWLRPVVIRPRALRAPRSAGTQTPAPAASRMLRVVIRPRAVRVAPAQAEPPASDAAQQDG